MFDRCLINGAECYTVAGMNDEMALATIRQNREYALQQVRRYLGAAQVACDADDLADAADYAQLAATWLPAFVQSMRDEAALQRGRAK